MTSATQAVQGRAALGLGALLLALLVVVQALLARQLFPHAGWMAEPSGRVLLLEGLATAALLAGGWAGVRALRRGGPGTWPAALALALLAPFAVDLALAPLPALLASATARRVVFLVLTVALQVAVGVAALRGAAAQRVAAELLKKQTGVAAPVHFFNYSRVGRLAGRAALLLVVLAAMWAAAELTLAWAGLGARSWSRPLLIVPGDERRVPLAEIALFRPFDGPASAQGLSARFRPYLFLKGWYDRPRWSYFDEGGHVDYVFDRYGLRDHDFERGKAAGEFRVVAIGDSFTFGVGVQLEDCWTEVLERGLRERRGGPVEVINAGFASGYSPVGYEEWIAKDGLSLQPDVVLVGLCLNDLHPGISLYAWPAPHPPAQPLAGRSRLLNALQDALDPPSPRGAPLPWTSFVQNEPETWEAVQAALRRTHALLAERGVRLVVVPFPMLAGLRETYPYAGLLTMVAEFCDAEGIERVDLLPRFVGLVDEDLWVHPTDQHPNDVGHRIIGEGVLDALAPR